MLLTNDGGCNTFNVLNGTILLQNIKSIDSEAKIIGNPIHHLEQKLIEKITAELFKLIYMHLYLIISFVTSDQQKSHIPL